MTPTVVAVIVIIGAFLVAVRRLVPEQIYFFQGMFRYETDLGWPHGVQEDDGERAWGAPAVPAREADADEPAGTETMGAFMSTIVELDVDRQAAPVPLVRVVAEFSKVRRDPWAGDWSGSGSGTSGPGR